MSDGTTYDVRVYRAEVYKGAKLTSHDRPDDNIGLTGVLSRRPGESLCDRRHPNRGATTVRTK